jgi:hypothetical protein
MTMRVSKQRISPRRACIAVAGLAMAGSALAHHSIRGKFDDGAELSLNGVVTKIDWRAPHAHVFVNVESDGEILNWAVELESPTELKRSGWSSETLTPGDVIVVDGWRARDGSRQIWGESVVRADSGYQVYTLPPRVGRTGALRSAARRLRPTVTGPIRA